MLPVCEILGVAVPLRVTDCVGVVLCDWLRVCVPLDERVLVRVTDCEGVALCVCERVRVELPVRVCVALCDWLGVMVPVTEAVEDTLLVVDWLRVGVPLVVSDAVNEAVCVWLAVCVCVGDGEQIVLRAVSQMPRKGAASAHEVDATGLAQLPFTVAAPAAGELATPAFPTLCQLTGALVCSARA